MELPEVKGPKVKEVKEVKKEMRVKGVHEDFRETKVFQEQLALRLES
jgi:hypothetical protein